MKKRYLTCFLVFISISLQAQVYQPMLDSISNTWYYTLNLFPVRQMQIINPNCTYPSFTGSPANTLTTIGDTVINSYTYSALLQQEYTFPSGDCLFGYLREDTTTRKIYFMDNLFSPEELIYDFSMLVGDTINLTFAQQFGYYTSGIYTLDSISTVTIKAGTRNIFYLNNHAFPLQYPLEWIESVGHPGHLIYTKSANFEGGLFMFNCFDKINRDFYQMLTCFEHATQKVYFDSCSHQTAQNNFCFYYADSCYYFNICGAVEEINSITNFSIAPNPATDYLSLNIESRKFSKATIDIYDLQGKIIMPSVEINLDQGRNSFKIKVDKLINGVYFAALKTNDETRFKKVVILRE